MGSWRDSLQAASFRGVPFEVMADSVPVGRRVQVHEFVQRDIPYAEDLGRATRPFAVKAFVCGDDCLAMRDALLAVLDEPGPGELILPAWGAVQAACTKADVSHAREEGRVVRFDLEFVECGAGDQPTAEVATAAQLMDAAGGVQDVMDAWFGRVSGALSQSGISLGALQSGLSQSFDLLTGLAGGPDRLLAMVGSVKDLANMVLGAPAGLLGTIRTLVDFAGMDWLDAATADALAAVTRSARVAASVKPAGVTGGAAVSTLVDAVQDTLRGAHLVAGMQAAAQLPVIRPAQALQTVPDVWQQARQPLARPDALYLPDVLAARTALDDSLWLMQRCSNGRPPVDVFAALQHARAAARRHMAQAAAVSVPMITITPIAVQPALVLAYRQWGDATRAQELVARNRVVHPGFVPQRPLHVARD